jgi:hypothetical protein
MRVSLHPDIDPGIIRKGNEVVLNESLNVVLVRDGELSGEVVTLKEQLEDKRRCVVFARADEERVAELSEEMLDTKLRSGDSLLMDLRTQLLIEKLPKLESESLVLEEVPDITYADVGGLDTQIEAITDAVELPYLHRELFAEYSLPAPKGILLYGPPGCGKTLIAKAVANSLAKKVAERRATPTCGATSSTSRAPSCSTSTWGRRSARSGRSSSGPGRRPTRACRSSSSSTRWSRSSAPGAPASAPTWSRPSCRSCWPRSTGWSRCATSSSSAPPTGRT